MARISQACSDASYLKIASVAMLVFLGVMFIPILGLLGLCGYWFLSIAIPVLAIRWWFRFARAKTDDPDFSRARKIVIVITALTVLPLAYDLLTLTSR